MGKREDCRKEHVQPGALLTCNVCEAKEPRGRWSLPGSAMNVSACVAALPGSLYRCIFARKSQPSGARRMRFLALSLILLAAVNVARADAVFKVGVTTRDFIPAEPYDWRGAKTHALRAMIWYPAAADAREEPQWIGPPIVPFFSAGSAARDAAPAAEPQRPLILLSHGAGGTAPGLAWLRTPPAAHRLMAVGVHTPGYDALEDYTVEGFSLWWLRAV